MKYATEVRSLIADLRNAGFTQAAGGKGSHRKFQHLRYLGSVVLSGRDGDDAQHYQEKQARNAIRDVSNES